MKHIKLTVDQYKSAIQKLNGEDKNKLITLYKYFPVQDMKQMAERLGYKSPSSANLYIGKLNTEIIRQANFQNLWRTIEGMGRRNSMYSVISKELTSVNKPTIWVMEPDLEKALQELGCVKPKPSIRSQRDQKNL